MTKSERNTIAEMWVGTASMFGKQVDRSTLKIMLDAVDDLGAADLLLALRKWQNDPKAFSFPTPGQLRNLIVPPVDPADLARETATRITKAVSRFGYTNPGDAREFIGEDGWEFIERYGGWVYLCQNLGSDIQVTTFIAQARDTLGATMRLERAGIDVNQPTIEQAKGRDQIGSVVRGLTNVLSIDTKKELTDGKNEN